MNGRVAMRALYLAIPLLGLGPAGCKPSSAAAPAPPQPIAYAHKQHLDFFTSGKHFQEKLKLHMRIAGWDTPPEDFQRGKCASCHEDLSQKTSCVGCHALLQDPDLQARKDVRACVACHPGVWTRDLPGIPETDLCKNCHGAKKPVTQGAEEARLRKEYIEAGKEIPWNRHRVLPEHANFPHKRHVKIGGLNCVECHGDVASLAAPPAKLPGGPFTMDRCLDCHKKRGVSEDCFDCHK